MDQDRFDQLARALGAGATRRAGLRAALGGLLGLGVGAATIDADATGTRGGRNADAARKRRRKRCKPACPPGQTCRKGACACDYGGTACGATCCLAGQSCEGGICVSDNCPSGIACGDACCLIGQACQDGQCVVLPEPTPEPGQCIPAGEPCKATGRACCGGRVCASGQGGEPDVACYVPKTGACQSAGDCVYGTTCTNGRCAPPPPPPGTPVGGLGVACDPAANVCTSPGAVCTPYTGDHPVGLAGSYCTLPLGMVCTGDPDCTCYRCWYSEGSFRAGPSRGQARAARQKACCGPAGFPCGADGDCCEDHTCSAGACAPRMDCTVCAGGACPFTTIADAILADVRDIRVGAGTYAENDLPMPPTVQSLRIRPCGSARPTVDAGQLARIMLPIPAAMSVTVMGLTLKNGKVGTGENGGGFRVEVGGALTLDGVTLADCEAGQDGGAIHSQGALTLLDSTVTRGSARKGGGIAAYKGSLTMTGSSVTECSTTGDGGGIYVLGEDADRLALPVVITDSTIADNVSADRQGGGINVDFAAVTMTRVAVTGNRLTRDYQSYGGGLYLAGTAPSTLTDCTIDRNSTEGYGGGLSFYAVGPTGTLDVIRGSISGNSAKQNGGGGAWLGAEQESMVTLRDVRIAGNWIIDDNTVGGGVVASDGTIAFTGTTRLENNQTNPAATPAGISGGGLFIDVADVSFGPDTVLAGNRSSGDGGGAWVSNGTLTVAGAVRDNVATGKGGGIYADTPSGVRSIILAGTAVVSGNTAAQGAGVYGALADLFACTGAPRVCANPNSSATPADNCGTTALGPTCLPAVCATGACPA